MTDRNEKVVAMAPVDKNSALWRAWEIYRSTNSYENTRKWALHPEHVDGSLWAAFLCGWNTALEQLRVPEGWTITKQEDGTIIVQHDDGGGYQAPGRPDNIAGKILYRLAKDMLAAAPEPGDRDG